jgi:hypothetical protein
MEARDAKAAIHLLKQNGLGRDSNFRRRAMVSDSMK